MTSSTTDLNLDFLLSRRSATALGSPGPTRDQLDRILLAAGAVPDHGLLRPFRFVIVEGDGRLELGRGLAEVAAERRPGMPEAKLDGIRAKALRSPTIIVIIASPKPGKVEVWEQHATAACAGYAITLAAHALGVGAVWKSVPFTKGPALTEILGLAEPEEMLGWIHLGTSIKDETAPPHAPLDLSVLATVIDGDGRKPYR